MCEYCHLLANSRERDKLEYIGFRVLDDLERYYYRCPQCDQAFYWLDWCAPGYHHIEALSVNASEMKELLQS